jgi:hypothetical protein
MAHDDISSVTRMLPERDPDREEERGTPRHPERKREGSLDTQTRTSPVTLTHVTLTLVP